MSEERSALERTIERLASRVARIEERLAAIERGLEGGDIVIDEATRPSALESPAESALPPPRTAAQEIVALIGRTLMVMGGAFALRAMTESGIVPQAVGTAMGIGYAILWLVLADRAAGRGRLTSAGFHALAAAAVAYPLLWEATVRFGFLTPAWSALALVAITGIALGVATRRHLRPVAWVFSLGAVATALGLAVATKMLILFVSVVLLLGLVTLLLAYHRGWRGLARLVAAVADLSILMLTIIVLVGGENARVTEVVSPGELVALQLALLLVYLGTFYARTLFWREQVTAEATLQGVVALLVGVGGAIAVGEATAGPVLPLGMVSLTLAIVGYGASFAFIDRALEGRRSFIFYTTTSLIFTLVGFQMLLGGGYRVAALAVVGLLTAWLGAVRHRATLSLHGTIYVVAAAADVGLPAAVVDAFTGRSVTSEALLSPAALLVLVAAALCGGFDVATHGKTWGRFSRMPKLLALLVLLFGVAVIAIAAAASLLPRGEDGLPIPAALATLRTGVLSLSAIGVALLGRWHRLPEAAWLVYPILVVGGAKLLIEDLRASQALTMFISLALYGGALILAPHLARHKGRAPSSSGPPPTAGEP